MSTVSRFAGIAKSELAFAIGFVALGVFTLLDAGRIIVPPGSASAVGPRGFPYLIGIALVGTGIAVVVAVLRGRTGEAEASEDVESVASRSTDWPTLAKLGGVVLVFIAVLEWIGWPLAATLLFGGTAWTLGGRPVRSLLIGLGLGVVTYAGFVYGLGVSLPLLPLILGM